MISPFKLSEITAMCLRTIAELSSFVKDRTPGPITDDAVRELSDLKHRAMHPQTVLDSMGWSRS